MLKKGMLGDLHFTRSIRNRVFLFFIFLVLVPTSIISFIVYTQSVNTTNKRIDVELERNMNMIEINIMQKFEAINDISNTIYLNPELVKILSSKHPRDKIDIINEMAVLEKILDSYNVANITNTELIPTLYMLNRPEYYQCSFSNKIFDLSKIMREKWYLNLPTKSKYTVLGLNKTVISSGSVYTIRIAKRLFGLKNSDLPYAALLTLDIGMDDFNNILNSFKPSNLSSIFIINNDCSVILSPDDSILGKDMSDKKYMKEILNEKSPAYKAFVVDENKAGILVSYKKIAPLNWTVISLSPLTELYGELINFKRTLFFVIAVCLVIAFIMALLLSGNISNPIRKLVKSMSNVQNGNFEINIDYKRNDEFSYLIKTYKKMVYDIKELINKLYVSEVNKKEAELKALQAQINPHFLYNTLDSINWLAVKCDSNEISTMVTSLSDFFRYNLNKGNSIISLGDEKKQVESYLTIQKIRFKHKLDYDISFPPQILHYLTIKLILQPIVENSIIHGIEKRPVKGLISITALKNDDIIEITICDNGVGGNADELNSALEESKGSFNSFAVKNINERIRQVFGEEYGLKFYNCEPTGMMVRIRFPAVETLEGLNVKNDYSG